MPPKIVTQTRTLKRQIDFTEKNIARLKQKPMHHKTMPKDRIENLAIWEERLKLLQSWPHPLQS